MDEDVLVPAGATLEVEAGTRVLFSAAPSTRTDPVYWQPGTELAVAGTLVVRGTAGAPVVFEGLGAWGGLVAAPGSEVVLEGATVRGADEGLLCVGARCGLSGVTVEGGEYGLVLGPGAVLAARDARVAGARVGVLDGRAEPGPVPGLVVERSRDAARLALPSPPRAVAASVRAAPPGARVEYLGEYTVAADEVWRGEVVLGGRVTVVPGATLTLEPGTRVAFRKLDTNGDGLGEGELLVLGGIRSLGEAGRPVVFESAEAEPAPGDWDKVSLIDAESPDSRFVHTVFRHGTQALHAHFSTFRAADCYFEQNLRAVQFQESEGAELERCVFLANKQALRFRDSRAAVRDSVFVANLYAVHAFRAELAFAGNTVEASPLGAFLAKESRVRLVGNRFAGNRDGIRMKDAGSVAEIRANRLVRSAEDALSLSAVEGRVEGNELADAGLDLVSLEDSPAVLTGNALVGAGRHALHLKGATAVDARRNWWGTADPGPVVHDRDDDPDLGPADVHPILKSAPGLDLPAKAW